MVLRVDLPSPCGLAKRYRDWWVTCRPLAARPALRANGA